MFQTEIKICPKCEGKGTKLETLYDHRGSSTEHRTIGCLACNGTGRIYSCSTTIFVPYSETRPSQKDLLQIINDRIAN